MTQRHREMQTMEMTKTKGNAKHGNPKF